MGEVGKFSPLSSFLWMLCTRNYEDEIAVVYIIIIIMKEFIVPLLQCGHERRCNTKKAKISSEIQIRAAAAIFIYLL